MKLSLTPSRRPQRFTLKKSFSRLHLAQQNILMLIYGVIEYPSQCRHMPTGIIMLTNASHVYHVYLMIAPQLHGIKDWRSLVQSLMICSAASTFSLVVSPSRAIRKRHRLMRQCSSYAKLTYSGPAFSSKMRLSSRFPGVEGTSVAPGISYGTAGKPARPTIKGSKPHSQPGGLQQTNLGATTASSQPMIPVTRIELSASISAKMFWRFT